jgi:hypothetical protein
LIAVQTSRPIPTLVTLHAAFLSILPRIERHAAVVFRGLKCPGRRADAVAEMTALCWLWFVRLARRGKDARRFPSTLATFAAKAVKSGRRVCGQEKAKDALSQLAQQRHGFTVGTLPTRSTLSGNPLSEALRDSTKSPPDEQAMFKLDMADWLAALGERGRRVAVDMMLGNRTKDLARMHGLTEGRISQLRAEFHQGWLRFLGELPPHPSHTRVGIA